MKKIICFVLILLSGLLSRAQTITIDGMVVTTSLQPVSNWPVNIEVYQGNWPFLTETVFTQPNGQFQFTTTVSDTAIYHFIITTSDCNQLPVDTSVSLYGGQSAQVTLTICDPFAEPCTAMFSPIPTGDTTNAFYFLNLSTGPFTAAWWDFGDGTTSSELTPTHTFAPGTWNVCLTIGNSDSLIMCSDTFCLPVTVINEPCYNGFGYTTNNLTVSLTGWNSAGSSGQFLWDLGDGTTTSGIAVEHAFSEAGVYTVRLTTIDINGCMAVSEQLIQVHDTGCSAFFIWNSISGNPGQIQFLDQSSGPVTQWHWNFGDGNSSGEQSPEHAFLAGNWEVCLTIATDNGCTHQYCEVLTVGDTTGCESRFNWEEDPVNPQLIHFTDQSTGDSVGWVWNFGDGGTSTEAHPDHLYALAGNYEVCLTIVTGNGVCQSTQCLVVSVGVVPTFPIYGQVLVNQFPADSVKVTLFSMIDNHPVLFDSAFVTQWGAYSFYAVPQGTYLIKAELNQSSSVFGQHLPTYYGNTLLWEEAVRLQVNALVSEADVYLVPAPMATSGTKGLSGVVVNGSKASSTGESGIAGVPLYLFNDSQLLIASTLTDVDGGFSFTDLPEGSFMLIPDVTGIPAQPFYVSLNQASTATNNLVITLYPDGIQYGVSDGVGELALLEGPWPNPASDRIFVEVVLRKPTVLGLEILDVSGSLAASEVMQLDAETHRLELQVSQLKSGLYLLKINTSAGAVLSRKFIVK